MGNANANPRQQPQQKSLARALQAEPRQQPQPQQKPLARALQAEPAVPRLLVSLDEVAHALGLSPGTIRNWRFFGRLPFPTVKLGVRCLVRMVDLQAFVDGLGDEPDARPQMAPRPKPSSASTAQASDPQSPAEPPRPRRGRPRKPAWLPSEGGTL